MTPEDILDKAMLSNITKNQYRLNNILENEEKAIFSQAKQNLLSGFLLKSLIFSENSSLENKLKISHSNYQLKSLVMMEELNKINKLFNDLSIDFIIVKGIALKILNIYPSKERESIDLDIIVKKEDINRAYEAMKSLKYSYYEKDASDSSKYIGNMHHLPPLSSNNGVIVEIHQRLTKHEIYKVCPFKDIFTNTYKKGNYLTLQPEYLISHSLYHGYLHHNNVNPIYIIDILNIDKKYEGSIYKSTDFCSKIGLGKILDRIIEIRALNTTKHSMGEIENIYKDIFNNPHKYKKEYYKNKEYSSRFSIFNISIVDVFSYLKRTSYRYQVSYFSIKFWRVIFKNIRNKISRF